MVVCRAAWHPVVERVTSVTPRQGSPPDAPNCSYYFSSARKIQRIITARTPTGGVFFFHLSVLQAQLFPHIVTCTGKIFFPLYLFSDRIKTRGGDVVVAINVSDNRAVIGA